MIKFNVQHSTFNAVDTTLKNALVEDIGRGDVTTASTIAVNHKSRAVLIAGEGFILAGIPFAKRIFELVDASIKFKAYKKDGDSIKKGTTIAIIIGKTRSLLIAERVALNFLQRLSGIATLTHRFVERVRGVPVKIVDTRKTTPNLRFFEKYAVKAGGGYNHRFGLFDGVLIKDNHISAAGGIRKAVEHARLKTHHIMKIEVEARNLREVKQALSAGADVIMLDNMPVKKMRDSIKIIRQKRPQTIIEASGNINLENVRKAAKTGVDLVSIGALTHSARAVDISMKIAAD